MEIAPAEKKYLYLPEEKIKLLVSKHRLVNKESVIEKYEIRNASDKMLGFLCDYWKLQVRLGPDRRVLHYFLKLISVTNAAKADLVKKLKSYEKELYFYSVIQKKIKIPDLRPWSAEFVIDLGNALVFEDMSALQYKVRDKLQRFDMAHTLEALRTLTRFHASSIIYEDRKIMELGRNFSLNEGFPEHMNVSSYIETNNWFLQCMSGALDAIKLFSNYTEDEIKKIERSWFNVWSSSLALANASTEYRNVICHRDLWNNNLMFHYKEVGENLIPDDCILVDFPVVRYQPPAGDVMLLLYCNLDPELREENMEKFLDFYLEELEKILNVYGMGTGFMDRKRFFESAEKQRQWGIIVCACLMPQFWIDDDVTTKIFSDSAQFNDILMKNKSAFIIKMMQSDPMYKEKVLHVFEEIVLRYCL